MPLDLGLEITESLVILVPLALSALGITIGRKVGFWEYRCRRTIIAWRFRWISICYQFPEIWHSWILGSLSVSFIVAGAICMIIAVLRSTGKWMKFS